MISRFNDYFPDLSPALDPKLRGPSPLMPEGTVDGDQHVQKCGDGASPTSAGAANAGKLSKSECYTWLPLCELDASFVACRPGGSAGLCDQLT